MYCTSQVQYEMKSSATTYYRSLDEQKQRMENKWKSHKNIIMYFSLFVR
jgi:hypothetical protein